MPVYALPPAIIVAVENCQPPPPGAETGSEYETWDNDRLFQFGTNLLKNGRSFNRAIQVFEIATRRQPKNVDYQLALGCAYASRFASVAQATRGAQETWRVTEFQERKAQWEKDQSNRRSPNYGKPAPVPPPPNVTPDDARLFSLTPEQSKQEIVRLAKQSLVAFSAAQENIRSLPPDKQGEANFVRGWGLFILRLIGKPAGIVDDAPPDQKKNDDKSLLSRDVVVISPKEVTDCFRESVKLNGENAQYWQSLGFALVPHYRDGLLISTGNFGNGNFGTAAFDEGASIYEKETQNEIVHAFEQALLVKPHDFDVLYSAACVSAPFAPTLSVSYLEKAAKRQSHNAALWYLLAEMQFRQAQTQKTPDAETALRKKAIRTIAQGNAAPQYQANQIHWPIPVLLRAAWSYRWEVQGRGDDGGVLCALANRLNDYAKKEDTNGHTDELLRAASASLGMGLRFIQLPHFIRTAIGLANKGICYEAVRESQKARPDTQKAQFLDKNAAAFEAIKAAEEEAIKEIMNGTYYNTY